LALLYVFDPSAAGNFFPKCPSYAFLGLYCPGCGITRALHALLHGQWAQAMAYNPLAMLTAPLLLWMVFKPAWLYHPITPKIAFVVLVLYAVLRNIPYAPFSLLAPHAI
jgi:hypothetical protein